MACSWEKRGLDGFSMKFGVCANLGASLKCTHNCAPFEPNLHFSLFDIAFKSAIQFESKCRKCGYLKASIPGDVTGEGCYLFRYVYSIYIG
jgi:hypothetical protein